MANQKNYKGIAKINKKHRKWFANEEVYALFCEAQSDYFEREQGYIWSKEHWLVFNRKQFLKECGVQKWKIELDVGDVKIIKDILKKN